MNNPQMKLYHATTTAKLARNVATGGILPPVRGWAFLSSALAWAARVRRDVVLEIDVQLAHPLPDHKPTGHAFWHDGVVRSWVVVKQPRKVEQEEMR